MYNILENEANKLNIDVIEVNFRGNIEGLYCENTIAISNKIETTVKKNCIIAEELGHFHTTNGDILDQTSISHIKQEKRARNWAYEKLVPIDILVDAFNNCITGKFELAAYIGVTDDFLLHAINHYKEKGVILGR